jgi:hypothetical protein
VSAWLWLLLAQGILGAADTLWYHERVYALPARARLTAPELRLHAARDSVYAALFLSSPFVVWQGAWAWLLAALLAAEIVITLADFVLEDRVRAPLGGVAVGERVMHTLMAIVYGAFLACFVPELVLWMQQDTGFAPRAGTSAIVGRVLVVLGGGVLLSGARDLGAACGFRSLQRPLLGSAAQVRQQRALELVACGEAQALGLALRRAQAGNAGVPGAAVDGRVGVAEDEGPA